MSKRTALADIPPAPKVEAETDQQKQERVNEAGKAIREILDKHNVAITVTSLNIQTGRILPVIEVVAKDLPL